MSTITAGSAEAYHLFESDYFTLLSGLVLPKVKLAYQTYGALNQKKDNAILFPTWFSATHDQNSWLIGPGRPLDPSRYFVISVNLVGNGLSTSPSNTPAPFDGPRFPIFHILDNVRLQQRMLAEVFGIEVLDMVIGRSMGAQTAFQWAASYPAQVRRLFALAGAPRTSDFTYTLINALKSALQADAVWDGGEYSAQPLGGLRAMGQAYAAWCMSPEYYQGALYKAEASNLLDYIATRWTNNFAHRDANNLLAMMQTWQSADIAADPVHGGDFERALSRIRCPTIIMPTRTDQIFPLTDFRDLAANMKNAELMVLDSVWGHRAGAPNSDPKDIALVDKAIKRLLGARI